MKADVEIRVQSYHMDGYGHVNNARYLEFLEEARWHFFRQHGLWEQLGGTHLVVARMDVRYRRAAVTGDVLRIVCRVCETASRQVRLEQQIVFADSGKIVVSAQVELVPSQQGKALRLPEKLYQSLRELIEL